MIVYKIEIGDYWYWGQTTQGLSHRKAQHICRLRKGKGVNRFMQSVWDKHGADSFSMEVVYDEEDELADLIEQELIIRDRDHDKCMNWMIGGAPGHWWKGKKQSKEHVAKRMKAHIGAKRSDETRRRMSEASQGKGAKPCSVSRDGVEWIDFGSMKEAAAYIDGYSGNVGRAMKSGNKYKGWFCKASKEV